MHPVDEEYRIQQQDRQYEERQQRYRPGWDDGSSYYWSRKYYKDSITSKSHMLWWKGWPSESVRDAVEQCQEIRHANDWAEYVFETWGWTVEQYNQWVKDENRKRREQWTKMDFNEKIRRGLV